MADAFLLKPGHLTIQELLTYWRAAREAKAFDRVELDASTASLIAAGAKTVQDVLDRGERVYGINTGFGSLAKTSISKDQVTELQRRLVLSHCAGVGEALPDSVVRVILLLKTASLAQGFSGVRPLVIERLLTLLNADALPVIPAQGSVGASGDLAPLAALSAALLGEGEIRLKGEVMPAGQALQKLGLSAMDLAAKEGLALLNGSQVSTALALEGAFRVMDIFAAALASGALSTDAMLGSDTPFDPRIHAVRGQPGQIKVAAWLRHLLAGSQIRTSHLDCDRVQDPYSLRCQPQVMGAAYDVFGQALSMIAREANAVSDNPLVFSKEGDILSGGNFHAEPVAMAADLLAIALSEIVALSERRIALMVDANMSALPAFLVANPGLNSGFMIAQVTAAALASEIKQRATPASIDSLPTSANQEDHVSMATHGARRLTPMAESASRLIAIELLEAAQGIDFRKPLETSPELIKVQTQVRAKAAFLEEDRLMTPDIEAVAALVDSGALTQTLWPEGELLGN